MSTRLNDVIRMSYGWFASRDCNTETLRAFVDDMNRAYPEIDREFLYSELERLHSVRILKSSSILEDHSDHVEWFNPSTNTGLKRDIEWHFWQHYYDYLVSIKNWPSAVCTSIDRVTSRILRQLEDPDRDAPWDRRGMVIGSVQSGKTANYTGLVAKAIDAGYRFVVILTGTHESLRTQTQSRLNDEIMGYDLGRIEQFRGQADNIGVRRCFRDHRVVQTLTSSLERGDFNKRVADQAGIVPSVSGDPIVLVIKKHVTIMRNLIRWATAIAGTADERGNKRVIDVPILVIDDECDYASVNTKKVIRDENGLVLEDCDPARTNEQIRRLLVAFDKSAYIGYTATPFANVFIHHDQIHPILGEDLFPRDFIITIEQPSNYIGAEHIFGMDGDDASATPAMDVSSLVNYVIDTDELIPPKHKKDWLVPRLPDSMVKAIKTFLLACAARRLRNSKPAHNSMLIHVTRFNDVQKQIHTLVETELRHQLNRMRNTVDPLADYRKSWVEDFTPVTVEMKGLNSRYRHEWNHIRDYLYEVGRHIVVRSINGTAKDSLDYRRIELDIAAREARGEGPEWEERGFNVIAIGGDKLSRGLTLDGLSTSYYLRASRMYDTLMQMGRWFGYRDGYEDLCRIYTTPELCEWYGFIASASRELRNELDYMSLINETPRNFGLRVRKHPGQLAVTSAGKMRNSETLELSYSGRISETVVFDLAYRENNKKALSCLLDQIRSEAIEMRTTKGTYHWSSVTPERIIGFLQRYRTDDNAARVVNPRNIAEFISEQQVYGSNDLTTWDVAIFSKSESNEVIVLPDGREFGCFYRQPISITGYRLAIKRLLSPRDEWIDFSEEEKTLAWKTWNKLLESKGKTPAVKTAVPSGPAIRASRPKERGLLMVYPIYGSSDVGSYNAVLGFAVSFPGSKTTRQVTYEVNTVYQDAED